MTIHYQRDLRNWIKVSQQTNYPHKVIETGIQNAMKNNCQTLRTINGKVQEPGSLQYH